MTFLGAQSPSNFLTGQLSHFHFRQCPASPSDHCHCRLMNQRGKKITGPSERAKRGSLYTIFWTHV